MTRREKAEEMELLIQKQQAKLDTILDEIKQKRYELYMITMEIEERWRDVPQPKVEILEEAVLRIKQPERTIGQSRHENHQINLLVESLRKEKKQVEQIKIKLQEKDKEIGNLKALTEKQRDEFVLAKCEAQQQIEHMGNILEDSKEDNKRAKDMIKKLQDEKLINEILLEEAQRMTHNLELMNDNLKTQKQELEYNNQLFERQKRDLEVKLQDLQKKMEGTEALEDKKSRICSRN
ncbi:CAP-Gly domain-containing linker protein 1-like [Silurus meridionalis]|uniref:CAP-Gly domain-containing linker protein 1-like n=1 Tax=Silurus meridionalis TaxID=175797 RepID=UPI001EE9B675|nr:CAP-Gly domain-containing linker protein 1-like [Silurus meridionalis]